jgi:tetratricopeptide (TPR) repeat protein/predicted Ser/Thr protein kinase
MAPLGEGGMGAVYKAHDRELDRIIALKVIRPELVSSSGALKRFKQEVLLASKVTHRNVVRIFDIGEAGSLKFITMEYVDGKSLKALITERGKLPSSEAVNIIRQILESLDAAHSVGVTHRDLKPQNIMIDSQGKALVMDFGIAGSDETEGLTTTGSILGTPDYMSPEQVKGQRIDARSDIYSLGIVFYELLTGRIPFKSDTLIETMFRRTKEHAIPPVEIEHTVPRDANEIVVKCMQMDPANRFQNAREVLKALETFDVTAKVAPWTRWAGSLRRHSLVWKIPLAAALVVLAVFGGRALLNQQPSKTQASQPSKPIQVLVSDFTAPPEMEGSVEQLLGIALEEASFIQTFDRGRARRTAVQLQADATRLDESMTRRIALREGIDIVVTGSLEKRGGGFRVSAQAIEASTGNTLSRSSTDTANVEGLMQAISSIASKFRSSLGDATPDQGRFSDAETFTANSLEAMKSYAKAQELRGQWEEAMRYYKHAIETDPNLGRAYAGLAASYANTQKFDEADRYYKLAMARIDRMTEREKYRTRGGYYLLIRDDQRAIQEFSTLVEKYPADSAGKSNLALAHFYKRDMSAAMLLQREFLKYYPRNVAAQNNLALYAMYLGDFETSRKEALKALELNPSYVKAHLALAISELAQGKFQAATDQYRKMESLNANGASMAASGLADIAIFEGRLNDAAMVLEAGSTTDEANNDREAASDKLAVLASVYERQGKTELANRTAARAEANSRDFGVLYRLALVYLHTGKTAKATEIASNLSKRFEKEPQIHARLIEAEILLKANRSQEAVQKLEETRQMVDTWLGHFALGRAYLQAGEFIQASSEFEMCWTRRGEATAVFLNERPSYHLISPLYYYIGRAQEGLNSPGAVERYRTFLATNKNIDDPLIRDARKRVQMMESAPVK